MEDNDTYSATTPPGNTIVFGVGAFLAFLWAAVGGHFVRSAIKAESDVRRETDDACALAAEENGTIVAARTGVTVTRAIAWASLIYELPSFSSFAFISPELWGESGDEGYAELAGRLLTMGINLQYIFGVAFGFFAGVHCLMSGSHVMAAFFPSCPNLLNSKLAHYAAPLLYDLLLFPCYECFFDAMVCDYDKEDGNWYMRRDASFECWSSKHTQSALFALFAVSLLYPSSLHYAVKQKNDRNPAMRLITVFNVIHTMAKCLICATFSFFREYNAKLAVIVLVASLSCHWIVNWALVPCKGRGRIVNNFRSACLASSWWAAVCACVCVASPAASWSTAWVVYLYFSALPLVAVGAWRVNDMRSRTLSMPTAPLSELLQSKNKYTKSVATIACGMLTNVSRAYRLEMVRQLENNLTEKRKSMINNFEDPSPTSSLSEVVSEVVSAVYDLEKAEAASTPSLPPSLHLNGENGDGGVGDDDSSRQQPRARKRSLVANFFLSEAPSFPLRSLFSSGPSSSRRKRSTSRREQRRRSAESCEDLWFVALSAKSIVLMMWAAEQQASRQGTVTGILRKETSIKLTKIMPFRTSLDRMSSGKTLLPFNSNVPNTRVVVKNVGSRKKRGSIYSFHQRGSLDPLTGSWENSGRTATGETADGDMTLSRDEEHALNRSLITMKIAVWLCWPRVARLAAGVLATRCGRLAGDADLLSGKMRASMLHIFSVRDECRVAIVTLGEENVEQKHLWVRMSAYLAGVVAADDDAITENFASRDMLQLVGTMRRCDAQCDPNFIIRANLAGVAQRFALQTSTTVPIDFMRRLIEIVLPWIESGHPWVQKYSESIVRHWIQSMDRDIYHDDLMDCDRIRSRLGVLDSARTTMRSLLQRAAQTGRVHAATTNLFTEEIGAVFNLVEECAGTPGARTEHHCTGGNNPMIAFLIRELLIEDTLLSTMLVKQPCMLSERDGGRTELFGKNGEKLTATERNCLGVRILNVLESGFLS